MIARALLLAAALACAAPAAAQTGGVQVAPVLVEMTPERAFGSLRVRNGRARPAAFEVDVYAWTQVNGEDVLTPTDALVVAPGVFETQPGGEQVIRIGAATPEPGRETAFRIIIRELPATRADGARLGFTLEMSLPVFITPAGARANVTAEAGAARGLVLTNAGAARARLISVETAAGAAIAAPRYLLAGAVAATPLPHDAGAVRVRFYEGATAVERIVQVDDADSRSSMR